MNLISWGSKRNVVYTKNLAPAEYTELLSVYFSEHHENNYEVICKKSGCLYEKALYDKELLTESEENEFNSAVDAILSYGNLK